LHNRGQHIMTCEIPPIRVLVVDDEPLICWSLAEALTECGDEVSEAGSGAAALRVLAAARTPIDVVLLDYCLPDCHDLALLAAMKRLAPRSQIILMSAYCTPEVAKDALAIGAHCVVNKPIDMRDVAALVREAVSRPH